MPKQEDGPLSLITNNWPALIALMAAVVGLVVMRPKLDSVRPTPASPEPPHGRLEHSVQARLWQDPLAGFLGDAQIQKLSDSPLRNIVDDMPRKGFSGESFKQAAQSREVLFLFVSVDGKADPSSAESRRRERYAALSALNTAGYVPVTFDQLSYVTGYEAKAEMPPVPKEKSEAPASGGSKKDFVI